MILWLWRSGWGYEIWILTTDLQKGGEKPQDSNGMHAGDLCAIHWEWEHLCCRVVRSQSRVSNAHYHHICRTLCQHGQAQFDPQIHWPSPMQSLLPSLPGHKQTLCFTCMGTQTLCHFCHSAASPCAATNAATRGHDCNKQEGLWQGVQGNHTIIQAQNVLCLGQVWASLTYHLVVTTQPCCPFILYAWLIVHFYLSLPNGRHWTIVSRFCNGKLQWKVNETKEENQTHGQLMPIGQDNRKKTSDYSPTSLNNFPS